MTPPLPLHLLAHQLLAYVIQEGRVGRSLWQRVIGRLPVYAEAIECGDAAVIVDFLVDTGMLVDDAGMLSIGPEGEHSYGFRHFIDLTGSFTSPPGFVARHGKDELGVLDAASLLTNEGYYETVLLGGRSWKINHIDWNRKTVWVEPAKTQGRSRWYGSGQALSAELCDAVRQVAAGVDPAAVTFTQRAQAVMAVMRTELSFARPGHTTVVTDEHSARWWTWAGIRANNSLVDALGDLVASRGDDLSIGLESGRASHEEVAIRLAELHPDALPTPSVAGEYAANLKFSDCLPEALALEVARQRLIDPAAVARVLDELIGH